jgi:hypothetical protein
MAALEQTAAGVEFRGSIDSDADVAQAARLASGCAAYGPDDDDEDPLGSVSCFACRYRRWTFDGFTCLKRLLRASRRGDPGASPSA